MIEFTLGQSLAPSSLKEAAYKFSVFKVGFSQDRLEIHIGFAFRSQKAEKHGGIQVYYGKFGAKTDCTMGFSNGTAGAFGGGAIHLIYVSLFI